MPKDVNRFYPLNPCYGITKPKLQMSSLYGSTASGKKLFPLHPGPGLCVPKGPCMICQKFFLEIEPVGYIKPKGRAIQYYHARCMKGEQK